MIFCGNYYKKMYFCIMENKTQNFARKKERMTYDMAFALNGKTPPQAVEVEQAILGALMINDKTLTDVIEMLRPEYFYKIEDQHIYKAIHTLFEQSKQVDMITVMEELKHEGKLEEAGGAYYITQLTNNVVSSAHAEYHARIIAEKYMQRELIRVSTETIKDAYDDTNDVLDLLDKAEQRLMDINDKNFHTDYHNMGDVVSAALEQIETAQEGTLPCSGRTYYAYDFSSVYICADILQNVEFTE